MEPEPVRVVVVLRWMNEGVPEMEAVLVEMVKEGVPEMEAVLLEMVKEGVPEMEAIVEQVEKLRVFHSGKGDGAKWSMWFGAVSADPLD